MLTVGGPEALDPAKLASADALVVCGGDGSVSRVASVCAGAGAPIYHAPTGNENLFARALGTARDPRRVVDHLEMAPRARVDLAACREIHRGDTEAAQRAEKAFVIMASAGPDAGVIRRVAAARTRAVGHLAYVVPVASEVLRPALPRVWCAVNGTTIADGQRGILVVANTREYALGLNPARSARLDDGVLTAVFMPCASIVGGLLWLARCAAGLNLTAAGARVASAPDVRVEIEPPSAWQIDGEWPRSSTAVPSEPVRLTMRTQPGVLQVIRPRVD